MGYEEATYAVSEIVAAARRDQISGLPPMPMKRLVVENSMGSVKTIINFTPPDDTVLNDQIVAYIKGVLILRKEGTAEAQHKDDGVVVLDAVRDLRTGWSQYENWEDTDVVAGTTYTYTAFAYTDHLVYDYKGGIARTITAKNVQVVVYGFHQDFDDLDPATSITYDWDGDIYDVRNRKWNHIATNMAVSGTMSIGSWEHFLKDELKNHPFIIDISDGTIVGQLQDNDYTKFLDGTTHTYSDSDTKNGFSWIEKIYMKEVYSQDGTKRDVYFTFDSTFAHANNFFAQGFIDDGNELDGVWIPMWPIKGNPTYININIDSETGEPTVTREDDPDCLRNISKAHMSGPSANSYYGVNTLRVGSNSDKCDNFAMRYKFLDDKIRTYGSGRLRTYGGAIHNTIRDLLYLLCESPDIFSRASGGHMHRGMYHNNMNLDIYMRTASSNTSVCGFIGTVGGTHNELRHLIFHSYVLGECFPFLLDFYAVADGGDIRYKTDYSPFGFDQNIKNNQSYHLCEKPGYYANRESMTSGTWKLWIPSTKMVYIGDGFGSIPDIEPVKVTAEGITIDEGLVSSCTITRGDNAVEIVPFVHFYGQYTYFTSDTTSDKKYPYDGIATIVIPINVFGNGSYMYMGNTSYAGKVWDNDGDPFEGTSGFSTANEIYMGFGAACLYLPTVGQNPYD